MKIKFEIILYCCFVMNCCFVSAQNSFNKLDEKGKKTGLWKGVYTDTKNLKYEGTFQNGKEIGLFTFYENTHLKTVLATREFNMKDNSAYTIFYDAKKNKISEGKISNKFYEGIWKYYHKGSQNLMVTENYIAGKLDGLRTIFYKNGKIAEEIMYKNDLKNGFYKKYTETGIVIEESNYKNNQFDGIAIFKDANSSLIVSKGKFLNGKKVGIWQFFENGTLAKEENMSFLQKREKAKKNE